MEADELVDHDSTFGGDRYDGRLQALHKVGTELTGMMLYRDSLASSSTSLISAVTKYQFEHGRRYHGCRTPPPSSPLAGRLYVVHATDVRAV